MNCYQKVIESSFGSVSLDFGKLFHWVGMQENKNGLITAQMLPNPFEKLMGKLEGTRFYEEQVLDP